ncbi:hypothetical protein [Gordonia sp. NPDC058843]|uniref:hypothetical protein n=1 Tax=Gordonia sp. NPDC058843 TaxID=3346648 RepID=UPI0036A5DADD
MRRNHGDPTPRPAPAAEQTLFAELHQARVRIASLESTVETLNRSLERLTGSTTQVTDIADRLARDNDKLRARAAGRTLIDWFNAAVMGLATRQQFAFQDSVIRIDDRAAAYHRGQGAAISERVRSLVAGAEICRAHPDQLADWVKSEVSEWKQRLMEPAAATGDAQHARDGWVVEIASHLRCLEELATLSRSTSGIARTTSASEPRD